MPSLLLTSYCRLVSAAGLLAAFQSTLVQAAPISVKDDSGRDITLPAPAKRIVSLAPHATELLFAAGAGKRIVGVSEYSNFPPEARKIKSIGGAAALDLERIVALKPTLVVAWKSGSPTAQVAKLKALGIPVFDSEPRDIEGIATSIERLARLAGTEKTGQQAADGFRERIRQLESYYRSRPKVRVFYQIWNDPLMTLNGNHLVSGIIRLCGGENIYAHLPQLTPSIEEAAVLKANPEVIISGDKGRLDTLIQWKRFKRMTSVVRNNLFTADADAVARPGPRVADGAEMICRYIDEARQKR